MIAQKNIVGIIGSGNWGSTVSKIIGENVLNIPGYESKVLMWVLEEVYEGEKLTKVINTQHENPKYLPGIKLPHNVVATPDLIEVVSSCSHLIFVLPHQFIISTCENIAKSIRKDAIGISLIKGLIEHETDLVLISSVIHSKLGIHMSVLSGANIANEIAAEKFSTTTIGCDDPKIGAQWKSLFSKPYFKVDVIPYTVPLEIFGALKNCVAVGIGFCDALGVGNNAKATAIRVGFCEIIKFVLLFQPDCPTQIFFQSFGLDDLIATCQGGRNVKAAEVFIRTQKALSEIEKDLLNGQKLQGPGTIRTVCSIITSRKLEQQFPFFMYIQKVLNNQVPASEVTKVLA